MQKRLSPAWVLFILAGLNLFNYVDRYVLSAVLEQIKGEFRLTDSQTGTLGTAFMLGYFLTCPIFGYLGDRFARKWLIAAGIFVWSLGTFLTGFSTSFAHILIFRVMVGVGEASYATLSPGILSDTFSPQNRNNAFTTFYSAIPFGAALGVLLGSFIGSRWGWHQAFFWVGAPGMLFAFILLPFREPERGESEGKAGSTEFKKKPSMSDFLGLLRIRDFNLVVWGYVFYTFAMGAYAHWVPAYLERVHHVPQAKAGQFFGAVMVVAGLLGTFLGGFAATAFQKRNPSGYALTVGLSVLLAVPFTWSMSVLHDPTLVMAAFAIGVFFLFVSTGPVNTLLIDAVPVNLRASAMAMSIFLIHAFGDVWSPTVVGKLSDAWGGLNQGLAVLPVSLLLAAVLWLVLASYQRKGRVLAA